MYVTLCNKDIIIEEKVNKRGCIYLHTRRMIITFTVRNMQNQLEDMGISISIGKVMHLCPFFITSATKSELKLCLCKLCLNTKMLFDPIKSNSNQC